MRIITGKARGRKLKAPHGKRLRPTADMVKEGLFNIIGAAVVGSEFLDLFAGTGNVGIEALSRGAERVDFVEVSRDHLSCIYENLRHCCLETEARVYGGQVESRLSWLSGAGKSYDFIFADPPYDYTHYEDLIADIDRLKLLKEGGALFLETAARKCLPERAGRLRLQRRYTYGSTALQLYSPSPSHADAE